MLAIALYRTRCEASYTITNPAPGTQLLAADVVYVLGDSSQEFQGGLTRHSLLEQSARVGPARPARSQGRLARAPRPRPHCARQARLRKVQGELRSPGKVGPALTAGRNSCSRPSGALKRSWAESSRRSPTGRTSSSTKSRRPSGRRTPRAVGEEQRPGAGPKPLIRKIHYTPKALGFLSRERDRSESSEVGRRCGRQTPRAFTRPEASKRSVSELK